jgi:hypothetical protein
VLLGFEYFTNGKASDNGSEYMGNLDRAGQNVGLERSNKHSSRARVKMGGREGFFALSDSKEDAADKERKKDWVLL